ncbi:hypothetical protein POKO110462_12980 [Pontibacter korlensis]|uniref:Lipoprotein n=1 Tax=Pontibacter korlensis TaxID=400092 RepID=A0A0E3ZEZ6_9BACT|nr:hypothetical protein [Pontibacter korlensis]AKD04034.1 hypothetical protein PKOR_14185 [Pontibacter korlensis]
MRAILIPTLLVALFSFTALWLTGCQTSSAPADTAETTVNNRNLPPKRVDIRGSITTSRYNEGQVMLEVENFSPSPDSRYNRAYVLVLPTTQIVGPDGRSISLSEIRQGQNVAILLRGGGQGSMVGLGVARKMWVEDRF